MQKIPQPKRMMMAVYVILLVFVVAILTGLRHCSSRSLIVAPTAKGASLGDTIDVAMLYAPQNYYLYGDTLGGYSYNLLRKIAVSERVTFNYIPVTSLSEALDGLHDGKFTIVASLPVSNELRGKVLFSDSVYTDRLVVVYHDGAEILESPLRLAGKTVHVAGESPAALRLANLREEIGDTIIIAEHADLSDELVAMKVSLGDFDYGAVYELTSLGMKDKFPQLKEMPVGFTQLQSWAVAPTDSALVKRINGWLERNR